MAASSYWAQKSLEEFERRHPRPPLLEPKQQPTKRSPDPIEEDIERRYQIIAAREENLKAAIDQVATRFQANPQRLHEIVYGSGDLEMLVGELRLLEFEMAHRIKAAAAARRIQTILEEHLYPFIGPCPELGQDSTKEPPYVLSKKGFALVVAEAEELASAAKQELAEIRQKKSQLGLYSDRESHSFQKMPVIRHLAVALCEYLVRCEVARQRRAEGLGTREYEESFAVVRGELRKKDIGAIYGACVDLLHLAFPTFARLTKNRVAAAVQEHFARTSNAEENIF